jgi:hypothetical protein
MLDIIDTECSALTKSSNFLILLHKHLTSQRATAVSVIIIVQAGKRL